MMEALLHEIRKDVFIQARGVEFGERFFGLIDWLYKMAETARNEGLLSLKEAAKDVPPEIGLSKEIQWINFLVTDGTDPDEIIDAAIAHYWMGNFQGEDALMYYMAVLGFLMIQAGEKVDSIRRLLVRYLPPDAIEHYEDYRECKLAPIRAEQKEKLLHDVPVLDEHWTLRTLLEEKILQAEDRTIQRMLRDVDNVDCVTALTGLSPAAKQKILSNISERIVNMIAEDCAHMGSVSRYKLMRVFGAILCIFEDVEKELAKE